MSSETQVSGSDSSGDRPGGRGVPPVHEIRVGVVGVGYWGSKQLRVMRATPGVTRVVAIDARLPLLSGMAHLLATGEGFTSLEAALPHVDAVVIATPPATHVPLGLAAIRAGKHVLIEKPLATTAAGAEELIQAAKEAGVTLMVGHTFEYNGAVWMLRELIQSRELGDLYYLDSSRLNLGLYQSDVNVVFDLAPHDISIANHVLGATPTSVQAWGARHIDPAFEDVAHLQLGYDDIGVQAHIHVSWLDPRKVRLITAVGSKKMAVYDDTNAEERIRVHDKAVRRGTEGGTGGGSGAMQYHHGPVTSPVVRFDEPLAVQARHFVDCLTTGAQPRTDGASGLAVVQVIEAAQLSLAQERKVLISEIAGDAGASGLVPVPGQRLRAPVTA
ncbi:Gfo/Idh/MocA family protein [Paractinoplanes rishiriensis]|uniref:Oxidoreductase n=1 Tax=Paractinoplanes rishiriensis TaxID=1050105 RepID=A0A919K450_9ACTN|nr:Gfo/Idh/MocA family oxidoreductase [Actinoplanes rishiriensis]GIE98434.1 oxidoreductase [Actinoplanes rishiriensis]